MNNDTVLYAPVTRWSTECARIRRWINENPIAGRDHFPISRPRPRGALFLYDFLEAYWEFGQRIFWRLEPSDISMFEFDGTLLQADGKRIKYPVYGEVGNPMLRSVEDANLIPNTYTHYFLFKCEQDAIDGFWFIRNPIVDSA